MSQRGVPGALLLRMGDGMLLRPGPPGYDLEARSGERFEVVEAGVVGLGGSLVSVNAGDTVTAPSGWRLT